LSWIPNSGSPTMGRS